MLNDLMNDFKKYNICWLVNFLKTDKGGINFGVCMKEQRVAFMDPASNVMKPFIVNDVFIGDNGICEDSRFCLNMNCEHNNNTPEQYIEAKGLDIKDFPEGLDRLQSNIADINQIIHEEKIKLQNDGMLYFELPVVTWKRTGK
jgi:hypothetical protein